MYDAKTNPRGRRPAAFFLAILLALSLSLAPAWAAEGEKQVIPLGRAVGIKLFSSGVLVVDLSAVTGESGEKSPAKSCGLKEGDVIEINLGQKPLKVKVVKVSEYATKDTAAEAYTVIE